MTNPTDPIYPPPDRERIERALGAMRARRAHLRRVRAAGGAGALLVLVTVVAVAVALSASTGHHLRVEGPSSTATSTTATTATTATTTTNAATTTTVAPAKTDVITYRPYTESGALDSSLHVTAHAIGTCVTGESNRTYRCIAVSPAATIYDPCFAVTGAQRILACPINPTSPDIVQFTTTAQLSGTPSTANRAWAFQLSTGEVCEFVSAAWGGLGPYDCQRNNSSITPADCRPPATAQPWWTADCQDQQTDASPFTQRQVSKVWF